MVVVVVIVFPLTLSKSLAEGRCPGSLFKHALMKVLKLWDHFSGSDSVGGGLLGIMKMARMGWMPDSGGFPSAISMAVIPRDQMSAFSSYLVSWITSGACWKLMIFFC